MKSDEKESKQDDGEASTSKELSTSKEEQPSTSSALKNSESSESLDSTVKDALFEVTLCCL